MISWIIFFFNQSFSRSFFCDCVRGTYNWNHFFFLRVLRSGSSYSLLTEPLGKNSGIGTLGALTKKALPASAMFRVIISPASASILCCMRACLKLFCRAFSRAAASNPSVSTPSVMPLVALMCVCERVIAWVCTCVSEFVHGRVDLNYVRGMHPEIAYEHSSHSHSASMTWGPSANLLLWMEPPCACGDISSPECTWSNLQLWLCIYSVSRKRSGEHLSANYCSDSVWIDHHVTRHVMSAYASAILWR